MLEAVDLWAALRQPLQALVDPAERIFVPAVVASMLLVWLVLGLRRGTHALRRGLWARKIWTHASARADITMMFAKALVFAVVRVPWLGATAAASFAVGVWFHDTLGPADVPHWSPLTITVLYTVVLFVAWDFSRYALHRVMHRVPALWSVHQVHHSASVLTPLTLHRVHPLESLLYDARGLVTTAAVTGTFLYLFRGGASELQLLGVNALGLLLNVAGGNLRHSHVWLRFGPLERLVLSPAQHQLHHSRRHVAVNFGTWLAVWDRCFGSWRPSPRVAVDDFGLDAPNHRPDSVLSMLVAPVLDALRGRRGLAAATAVGVALTPAGVGATPFGPGMQAAARLASRQTTAPAPPSPDANDPRDPSPSEPIEAPDDADLDTPSADDDPDAPQPDDASPPPEQTDSPEDEGAASPEDAAPEDPVAPPDVAGPDAPSGPADPPTDGAPEPSEDEGVDFELELDGEPPPVAPAPEARSAPPPDDIDPAEYDVAVDQISIIGSNESAQGVAGSAHVVGEEELERRENDDLHRSARNVPGLYIREEDGLGLRPNIGLRGASSDRSAKVTLMEDGILLAPAAYSAPAAYYFPLVTRLVGIEVYKGPASIRYGPNTIGGAINVLTRPIPRTMEGYGDVALGMRGYGKVHGYWGTTYKRFGVLLEGARVQSNGFKELDGGGDTGFDKNDFMVKLRYSSDPNRRFYHQVDVKGGFATERSRETYLGLTDSDFAATPFRRYAASQQGLMRWWRSQAEAGYFVAKGTIFDLQLRGYRHDFDRAWRKFNNFRGADIRSVFEGAEVGQTAVFAAVLRGDQDSVGPTQTLLIGTNDRRFAVNGGTAVAHVRPTWRWLEQDIEVGARVHHDQIVRDHVEDGYLMVSGTLVPEGTERVRTTNNRGTTIAGAFHLLDTIRIKWFSVMPGARVEVIGTEFNDRLTATETSSVNTVFLPGIGMHAQATPWLGVLAGIHSGFSPVAPGQSDEVRPERSINYELGARVDHTAGRTRTRAEAIGFLNDYSNLTGICTLSAGCDDRMLGQQFNAGRVSVYGAELLAAEQIELPKKHFIEFGATYTYTGSYFRTTFSSASPQLTDVVRGDQLPYVPQHLLAVSFGVGGRIWGVFPSVNYVGDMRDVAGQGTIADAERIPAHYVLDLATQVRPTKRSTLYLNMQNLTNNRYLVSRRPFGARPGLPFQLMAGFKYHFS